MSVTIIHTIHTPLFAKSFIDPIVSYLNRIGFKAEIWVENIKGLEIFYNAIKVPKRVVETDITFNPILFYLRLSKLRRSLKDIKPQAIHTHTTRSSLLPLLAAFIERIPIRIYHNHGLPYLGYKGILRYALRILEMINVRLATHVLFVSISNLNAAHEDGLLPFSHGEVIANGSIAGIDLSIFNSKYFNEKSKKRYREILGISEANFVLGYIGRPLKRKGFHLLFKVWEKTGLGENGAILLIAGCTTADCDAAIGHSVAGVKVLGHLLDLRAFYATCDAIILLSSHEGMGYCLLEGGAAGKLLIGTDIPGIRCVITNLETGILVPVRNEKIMVDTINKVAKDPLLYAPLGIKARERIKENYSREHVLKELLSFYNRIMRLGIAEGQIRIVPESV
jgi:N,N'-diacetylbacillosaminyl-diphospho-undecaprenol alpha-1,3-N-acetylgalactosaminyltransferase